MQLTTTLTLDEFKIINSVVKHSEKYAQTGIKGYLTDLIKQLSNNSAKLSMPNLGQHYEDLLNQLEDDVDAPLEFTNDVKASYTLNGLNDEWLEDLNDDLSQESFWNLERIADYFLVQNFTSDRDDIKLVFDDNTQLTIDSAVADLQINELQKKAGKNDEEQK